MSLGQDGELLMMSCSPQYSSLLMCCNNLTTKNPKQTKDKTTAGSNVSFDIITIWELSGLHLMMWAASLQIIHAAINSLALTSLTCHQQQVRESSAPASNQSQLSVQGSVKSVNTHQTLKILHEALLLAQH